MKIEAGKRYKTRANNDVRIYATDGIGKYPVHGASYRHGWVPYLWDENGKCCDPWESSSDIDREAIDRPEMDWSALPRWAKWIARHEGGCWYWFTQEPRKSDANGFWYPDGYPIPSDYWPKWSGDWKDSLTEVPRKD